MPAIPVTTFDFTRQGECLVACYLGGETNDEIGKLLFLNGRKVRPTMLALKRMGYIVNRPWTGEKLNRWVTTPEGDLLARSLLRTSFTFDLPEPEDEIDV